MLIYKSVCGKEIYCEGSYYLIKFKGLNIAWFTTVMAKHYMVDMCKMVACGEGKDYADCVMAVMQSLEDTEHETI